MSEDEFTVTPFFDDPLTEIHPSIGVVDGVAYVGVWVPCRVQDREGRVKSRDFVYLITDKREKILCTADELAKHHWRLGYKPIHTVNRWALADVQTYLNGQAVNVLDVYDTANAVYREFIEFPDEKSYTLHALWSIGTYFHHLFNTYSYLYVGGVKRTGKTKTLTVHFCLDLNAILSGNMSVSSLYRTIQNQRASLLIDETEKLSNPKRAEEFRNILLSGYKKGAKTYRVGKDSKDRLEPEEFELYSGKVLANISGLEDVLEDRCIVGFQKRSISKAIINREIDIMEPRFSTLRGRLYTLFLTYWREVAAIYAEISKCSELGELCERVNCDSSVLKDGKEYLAGRELELWKPLLTMARFFDDHTPVSERVKCNPVISVQATHTEEYPSNIKAELTQGSVNRRSQRSLCSLMLDMACTLAGQRHTENMTEVGDDILIACLFNLVSPDHVSQWIKVKMIKEEMSGQFEESQDWLTSKWIGTSLRRLGFSDKRRVGIGYQYNIQYSAVIDLKQRMQVDPPTEPKKSLKKTLESAWQWISSHKDENGLIDISSLEVYLKESGESHSSEIIDVLKRDKVLFAVPMAGKLGAG